MSTPTRFQTGVREPKNAPAIAFASIRAGGGEHEAAPVYPPVDYLAELSCWQVLGNDKAGDCVAVWWANQRRLTTHKLATENYPDLDQVWALYKTQNPLFDPADPTSFGGPNDEGMEPQTLLEYLVREGGPDGVKALAFAKLDQTDLAELKAAVTALGSVLLIVSMTEAQQEQFQRQAPWDFDGTSAADGLHAILVGGHLDEDTGDLTLVTWGAETELTDAFFDNAVVQAWAVVWPEHLSSSEFQDGIDVQALAAEYEQITGDPFPADLPTPQPGPAPAPGPGPSPAPDPEPAPDGDPDEAFAGHLDYYLGDDPFNWDVQTDHRNRIRQWLAARSDIALPGSPRDRQRTQERVAAEAAADAQARIEVDDLHLADQRAQADNERVGFPQHAPGEDRLEAAAERGRVMAEVAAEAQRDREQREADAAAESHPVAGGE